MDVTLPNCVPTSEKVKARQFIHGLTNEYFDKVMGTEYDTYSAAKKAVLSMHGRIQASRPIDASVFRVGQQSSIHPPAGPAQNFHHGYNQQGYRQQGYGHQAHWHPGSYYGGPVPYLCHHCKQPGHGWKRCPELIQRYMGPQAGNGTQQGFAPFPGHVSSGTGIQGNSVSTSNSQGNANASTGSRQGDGQGVVQAAAKESHGSLNVPGRH